MGTPTLRTNALTTLEALKQLLGIDETDTSQDGVLIQLINRASASIENALGRKLRRSTYTERVKGTGSQYLLVENYPIVAVEEIKQAGEIIDPGLYDITVRRQCRCDLQGRRLDLLRLPPRPDRRRHDRARNITVRYTAGYILPWEATDEAPADLPADLEGLAQEMVQYIFGKLESGGSGGLKAFSISDVRWEWSDETPSSWQDIINQYKRVWL